MATEKNNPDTSQRYPWARALLVIVLYGALLVFLWHFPTEGGRVFFQDLFRGFLYVIAGLLLVGITLLFFVFLPLPARLLERIDSDADDVDEDAEDRVAEVVFSGRAFMIPGLQTADNEAAVWEILYAIETDFKPEATICLDAHSEILTITDDDPEELDFLIEEIRTRLRALKLMLRAPR
ncbi:MAG TPA: hypothetical protein PKH77_01940 [Anaerolineae bacterium]|nr:hypothetical protein [Anaerolineae bacterium]